MFERQMHPGDHAMLEALVEAILRYTEKQEGPSPYIPPVENMFIIRSDQPNPPVYRLSRPAMCIVAQGAKWANFGGSRFEYKAGEALIVGVETPSVGRVAQASPDQPCLVLAFELDLDIMRSVAAELEESPKVSGEIARGVFVTNFDGPIADCAVRMVRLLDSPKATRTLYPVIMREICYWLLVGPHGSDIARMAMMNTPSQRVLEAMRWLREHFSETVRVEKLADIAQLSLSAFHRQFKALTSLSPMQYQKQLRLLEGRRLMALQGANAETAAFEVGYESASQFSREYARMFGEPPRRDLKRMKSAGGDTLHAATLLPSNIG
jgi:AraC-like DNA-binding protein